MVPANAFRVIDKLKPQPRRAAYTTNSFDLPLQLSYELDVFGKARRSLESARESAAAQEALYRNVLLTIQSGGAQKLFHSSVAAIAATAFSSKMYPCLQDALDLAQRLRAGGASSDVDYYQAKAQLDTVRSSAVTVDQNIANQIHALAVLVGQIQSVSRLTPNRSIAIHPLCRSVYPANYWNVVPTSPPPSEPWLPSTRRSASPSGLFSIDQPHRFRRSQQCRHRETLRLE